MQKFLVTDSAPIEYTIRRSKRAKRLSISLSERGTVVTIPYGVNEKLAERFVKEKEIWIVSQSRKYNIEQYNKMSNGSRFEILSEEFQVTHEIGEKIKVLEESGVFLVQTPEIDSLESKKFLSLYIRKNYGQLIKARTEKLADSFGFNYNSISIRDQSTRWGSCSNKKNLNFNWRLIFAPLEVMDYVIIHELAHTHHMNHSSSFWNLVEKYEPNFKQYRKWLKTNRPKLLEY